MKSRTKLFLLRGTVLKSMEKATHCLMSYLMKQGLRKMDINVVGPCEVTLVIIMRNLKTEEEAVIAGYLNNYIGVFRSLSLWHYIFVHNCFFSLLLWVGNKMYNIIKLVYCIQFYMCLMNVYIVEFNQFRQM